MANGFSRAGLLRRGLVGGGALLVSGAGLSGFAGVTSAATIPDADLAYLRLLIAVELLALDFQIQALASGKLRHVATPVIRKMRADERAHYTELAALMVAAGQTPATSDDINFSYPTGSFAGRTSIMKLAEQLEHLSVGAYLGAVENVATPALRLPIGEIAANEAQHVGALAALAGRPVIGRALARSLPMDAVSDALDRYES